MASTVIDLIRHGEPVGGIRFRGQTDDPLNTKGWQQMEDALGDYRAWDLIVSSPLLRCREFAERTAERLRLPLEIEPRFREIGFGSWEGLTAEEIARVHPSVLKQFYRDPAQNPPAGGEALSAFQARVTSAWEEMLATHGDKHILLVCHGGTIRIILSHLLQISLTNLFRLTVMNAGITRIQHFSDANQSFAQLIFHHGKL
ncbi:MAG: histidine phosphatase family protein [Methylococcales bacterium]